MPDEQAKGIRTAAGDDDELVRLLDEIQRKLSQVRPIPEHFERTFEVGRFEACDFCRRPLLQNGEYYMIIKYHTEGELKQEMAICQHTMTELGSGYSAHSSSATRDFYLVGELVAHQARLRERPSMPLDQILDRCWRCSKPRSEVDQWFDYAAFDGKQMLVNTYPFMQCGECTVELVRSLSPETVEMRRRFFEIYFGPPPGGYLLEPAEYQLVEIAFG